MAQYMFSIILTPHGYTTDIHIPAMKYYISGFQSNIDGSINHAKKEIQGWMNIHTEEYIRERLSDSFDIEYDINKIVVYIVVDPMRRNNTKYVKKTVTIPQHLNEFGIENGINFSKLLSEALNKQFDALSEI